LFVHVWVVLSRDVLAIYIAVSSQVGSAYIYCTQPRNELLMTRCVCPTNCVCLWRRYTKQQLYNTRELGSLYVTPL